MHLLESRLGRYVAFALALSSAAIVAAVVKHEPQGRVVVTETQTEILDVIEFAPGTAALRAKSFATLEAVAATLRGNPGIELVEVQSHTSGVGSDVANLDLSIQRAAVVRAYIIGLGVEPARLAAQGYGDTQPLDVAGSSKNERIAFLILQRFDTE
jgi:outer membrane protein OmpA-like peptidoglycan-associated protein